MSFACYNNTFHKIILFQNSVQCLLFTQTHNFFNKLKATIILF